MSKKKMKFESVAARELFDSVMADFDLDVHHVQTLKLACDSLDRIEAAREALGRDGNFIPDRYGQLKQHPAARTLEQNKIIFSRLLRELNLDDSPADSRPPRLGYGG